MGSLPKLGLRKGIQEVFRENPRPDSMEDVGRQMWSGTKRKRKKSKASSRKQGRLSAVPWEDRH